MKFCSCLLVFLFLFASSLPDAAALSQADEARLAAGGVIIKTAPDPDGSAGQIDAIIDIPAKPASVWTVMLDCERSRRFLAGLEACKILQTAPDKRWDIREHRVRWAWFLPSTRSVFRSEYDHPRLIRFSRVEGDLKHLQGEWRLEPLNGGASTRLFYHARIDPGVTLPNAIVRSAIEQDLPKTLKALRDEVAGEKRS